MTVTSVKRGADPDILKIGLSDGSLFFIRLSYLPSSIKSRFDSLLTQNTPEVLEISEAEQEQLLFTSQCVRAERKALQLISRAEQTQKGLLQKLERSGYPEGVSKKVLERLVSLELVDDRRFARAWIQSQTGLSPKKSASQLVTGLIRRGVDGRIAEESVTSLYPVEVEARAIAWYLRKKGYEPEHLYQLELKQILRRAGFSKGSIRLFIDEIASSDGTCT